MKQELRLSGTGGQGLITAGIILAEAALLDGKLAIQSQSYGPEARGGASKAEVIISDEAIHFPKVTDPNLLLAMSQEAATKYSHDLTAGSVMITDSLFVSDVPDFGGKVYELPITHSAKEVLGKALFANIIALGALVKLTDIVSEESLVKAVLNRVPKGTEEKNKQALQVLKEKTGVNFVYNTKDVDDRTIVSANVDNRSVEEALKLLLDQTSYVYERVKDYFLIKKGNKAVAPDLRTVRGIVRDENGQPLPGVNVRIEGTYVGRSTDTFQTLGEFYAFK